MTAPSSFVEAGDDRLRQALDAMPHKVWIVRPHGPALYYNKAMRAFAGAVLDLPDRASREKALLHPEDLGRVAVARDAAIAAPQDWSVEARLKCPDGGWRWHRLNFSMLWSNDDVDAWLATATDIQELQQAIAAAQQSEEYVRLAAEAAQLGIYSFDLETREHMWSRELKMIAGLPLEASAPVDLLELIHPGDRERIRGLRRASFDPSGTGIFQDEHRIIRPDGSIRWVMVKGRVSFAGDGAARKPKRGLGFVLDITERKAAESALLQSEERYRALVENANDIVATLDLEGNLTSVNPAVERIIGYAPQELIGTPLKQYVPEEEMPLHEDMLRRKLAGETSTQYEMVLLAKDGQKRFTLEVNSNLTYQDGKAFAIHSIARDITERKDAEARQRLLACELQHRSKNMLAVIQSIVTRTLRGSRDLTSAEETLIGRLHALAHAQEFVASGPGGGVPLRQLVEAELAPFAARTIITAEELVVGGAFAQTFALLVHELATNAIKHGALSAPRGRVVINWKIDKSGEDAQLHFAWMERGGPAAKTPKDTGMGTLLMSSVGKAQFAFKDEGFEYVLTVPLEEAQRGRE